MQRAVHKPLHLSRRWSTFVVRLISSPPGIHPRSSAST